MTIHRIKAEVAVGQCKSGDKILAKFENSDLMIENHSANYVPPTPSLSNSSIATTSTVSITKSTLDNLKSTVKSFFTLDKFLQINRNRHRSTVAARERAVAVLNNQHSCQSDNPGSNGDTLHYRHNTTDTNNGNNWIKQEKSSCVQSSSKFKLPANEVQCHFYLIHNRHCGVGVCSCRHSNKHRNRSYRHNSSCSVFPFNLHRIITAVTATSSSILVSLVFLAQFLCLLNPNVANCQSIHNHQHYYHQLPGSHQLQNQQQLHLSQQKTEGYRINQTNKDEKSLFGTKLRPSGDSYSLSSNNDQVSRQLTKSKEFLKKIVNNNNNNDDDDGKHDIESNASMPANLRQFSNLNEDLVFEDSTDVESNHYGHNDNSNYTNENGTAVLSSDYENMIPSDSNHFSTNQDNMVILKFNQSEQSQFMAPSVSMPPQSVVTSNQLRLQIHHGDGSFSQIERAPLAPPPLSNGQAHPATEMIMQRYNQVSNSIHSFDPHSQSGYPNFRHNNFASSSYDQHKNEQYSAVHFPNNGMQFHSRSDLAPEVQFEPKIDDDNQLNNIVNRDILSSPRRLGFNYDRVERVDSDNRDNNPHTTINSRNANNHDYNNELNTDNNNRQFTNAMKEILNNHLFLRRKASLKQNFDKQVVQPQPGPNIPAHQANQIHDAGDHILRPFMRKDHNVRNQATATSNYHQPSSVTTKHSNDLRNEPDWVKMPVIELQRIRDKSIPIVGLRPQSQQLNNDLPRIFNKRMPLLSNDEGFILPNVSDRNREITIDKRADFDGDISAHINNNHIPNNSAFRRRFGDFAHDPKANHILNNEQNLQPHSPNFDNSFRMGDWIDEISMNDLDLDDIPPNQLPQNNNNNNNNNNFLRRKQQTSQAQPNQRNMKPTFDGQSPPLPPPASQMMPLFFDKFLSDFININQSPPVSQEGFTLPPAHSQVTNQRNFGSQDPSTMNPNEIADLDGPNHVERRLNTGNHLPPSPKLKPENVPHEYSNEILPPNEFENDFNIWPKIFRFTDGRINLHEFEREKKRSRIKFSHKMSKTQSLYNIKRDSFLILHGGTFSQ